MKKYSGILELLEQYMVENNFNERWVTVQELLKTVWPEPLPVQHGFGVPAQAGIRAV
jgi:hypothetical protein